MTPGSDFHFDLPSELIAQDPSRRRGDSRLLLVDPDGGVVGEQIFRELPTVLRAGDLLVLNESRVLPARLFTRRVGTGGRVEILLIRPESAPDTWLAMARPGRRMQTGVQLYVENVAEPDAPQADAPILTVTGRRPDGMILVAGDDDPARLAERFGVMPLPPYIRRDQQPAADPVRDHRDRERYQTVFARPDQTGAGSVAAPTAGLHFSDAVLARLAATGVDAVRLQLHVGPGTFQPPNEEQIRARRLHREWFHLPAATAARICETRRTGGRVIAVGTTSLRVLETVGRLNLPPEDADGPEAIDFPAGTAAAPPEFHGRALRRGREWEVSGETRLFLQPPDRVTAADGLLTNFHLPGSSLLMLVAALLGPGVWRDVYDHAVRGRLRFYSYGDCMLILPRSERNQR